MRELIENLTNFYRILEVTADAVSIIYQHEVLAGRLHGLEKDHNDINVALRGVTGRSTGFFWLDDHEKEFI